MSVLKIASIFYLKFFMIFTVSVIPLFSIHNSNLFILNKLRKMTKFCANRRIFNKLLKFSFEFVNFSTRFPQKL